MSWKGDSRSNGGRLFFRWGASYLRGGRDAPWGASILMREGRVQKNRRMGGSGPDAPTSVPTNINLLLIDPEMLSSGSGKAKSYAKNFT